MLQQEIIILLLNPVYVFMELRFEPTSRRWFIATEEHPWLSLHLVPHAFRSWRLRIAVYLFNVLVCLLLFILPLQWLLFILVLPDWCCNGMLAIVGILFCCRHFPWLYALELRLSSLEDIILSEYIVVINGVKLQIIRSVSLLQSCALRSITELFWHILVG